MTTLTSLDPISQPCREPLSDLDPVDAVQTAISAGLALLAVLGREKSIHSHGESI
jgi:hypothetical protein